jgi:flavin reductase (DIM6/NTAB) family NADH-FMN oxidoreductase RutF
VSDLDQDFKDALASWASGVSVVACRSSEGLMYGLTVSSFASVSLDPPLVLVCLNNANRLPTMIEQAGGFTISILSRGQEETSNYFASRGREPSHEFHEDHPGQWTAAQRPVVQQAAAWLCCDLHQHMPAGTHTLFLGRVVEARTTEGKNPLLYFRRGYRGVEGV